MERSLTCGIATIAGINNSSFGAHHLIWRHCPLLGQHSHKAALLQVKTLSFVRQVATIAPMSPLPLLLQLHHLILLRLLGTFSHQTTANMTPAFGHGSTLSRIWRMTSTGQPISLGYMAVFQHGDTQYALALFNSCGRLQRKSRE